jgi:hypothetical protein
MTDKYEEIDYYYFQKYNLKTLKNWKGKKDIILYLPFKVNPAQRKRHSQPQDLCKYFKEKKIDKKELEDPYEDEPSTEPIPFLKKVKELYFTDNCNIERISSQAFLGQNYPELKEIKSNETNNSFNKDMKIIEQYAFKGTQIKELILNGIQLNIGVFENCAELRTLIFAQNEKRDPLVIGIDAFKNCKDIGIETRYTVKIPRLLEIKGGAFIGCKNLKTLYFSDCIDCFEFMGTYYVVLKKELDHGFDIQKTDNLYKIISDEPEGEVDFDGFGFIEEKESKINRGLENINLRLTPEEYTDIKSNFNYNRLVPIDFPSKKKYDPNQMGIIHQGAFDKDYIEKIRFPNYLWRLKPGVFENFQKLEKLLNPICATNIGENAFKGCDKLESISFERKYSVVSYANKDNDNDITTYFKHYLQIYKSAFENCSNLKDTLKLPVLSILGKRAFKGCNYTKIEFSDEDIIDQNDEIPSNIEHKNFVEKYTKFILNKKIEIFDFNISNVKQVRYGTDKQQIHFVPEINRLIISSLGINGNDIIKDTKDSTKTLQVWDEIIDINGLVPKNNPREIINKKFYDDETNIIKIKRIASQMAPRQFNSNTIEDDEIIGYSNFTITNEIFNLEKIESIKFPNYLKIIDIKAFKDFFKLKSVDMSTCNKLKEIKKSAFEYTVLENIDLSNCVNLIEIEESVFKNSILSTPIKRSKQDSVLLPNSLKVIKQNAFNSSSLKYLDLSNCNKLEKIGNSAFENCKQLESVKLPGSLKDLGVEAFKLSKVKELDISNCINLETIPEECFNLTLLKEVKLPKSIKYIKKSAFSATDLNRINFIDLINLQVIEENAFSEAEIEELNFSKCSNLKEIQKHAFRKCKNLKNILFAEYKSPKNLKLGAEIFDECNNLEEIIFKNDLLDDSSLFELDNEVFSCSNNCISLSIKNNEVLSKLPEKINKSKRSLEYQQGNPFQQYPSNPYPSLGNPPQQGNPFHQYPSNPYPSLGNPPQGNPFHQYPSNPYPSLGNPPQGNPFHQYPSHGNTFPQQYTSRPLQSKLVISKPPPWKKKGGKRSKIKRKKTNKKNKKRKTSKKRRKCLTKKQKKINIKL